MSSRTETYDKPIFNTLTIKKETVPIEGSKIEEPKTLAMPYSFAVPNRVKVNWYS